MADNRFVYDFENDIIQGTTWNGANCTLTISGTPPPSAITAISTTFTNTANGQKYTLTSASGGGITIVSGAAGTFNYDEQVISWDAGLYTYNSVFTFADDTVKAMAKGKIRVKEQDDM